jgi:hypothetical protein
MQSVRLDIVEGLAPSEKEKETAHGVTAVDVGALTVLRTFARTGRRKMMVINLDRLGTLGGSRSG